MSRLPHLSFLTALIVIGGGAWAYAADETRPWQSIATRAIGIENGLPSNGAPLITQTRDGYLWFGTEAGLVRYDGVQLTTFRRRDTPGLADNLIRAFAEDEAATLWVGTQAGLTRCRQGLFEAVPQFAGIPVSTVATDQAGHVWIGTLGAGLWEYANDHFVRQVQGDVMRENHRIVRVFCDARGRVWISLRNGGLVVWDQGKFSVPDGSAGVPEVYRFAEDAAGTLWLATAHGLYQSRAGSFRRCDREDTFADNAVTDVFPDREGRIWLVARKLYVALNAEAEFRPVTLSNFDYCRTIIEDREGSYWLGTAGSGVVSMRPSAFRVVHGGIGGGSTHALASQPDGTVWAAVVGRGLVRVDAKGATKTFDIGADRDTLGVVQTDGSGGVWFATAGALGHWANDRIERFPEFANVRAIFRDRSGTIWFGPMSGGVWCHREGKFISMAGKIGEALWTPSAFFEDKSGGLYVGFLENGLVHFDPQKGTTVAYNASHGLPDPAIRCIYEDSDNNLWVGSKRRGLAVWRDGRWLNPDTLSEPFGDLVNAIVEDTANNLWLGTARGVAWAPKKNVLAVARGDQTQLKFQIAGPGEGVSAAGVGFGMQPEWCEAADGVWWFATRAGVVAVQPSEVMVNTIAPPVVIEDTQVDGRRSLTAGRLTLVPGVRSLVIDYTALSFVRPDRIAFRYRLEGHDPGWIEAGTRRAAYYSNLEPGTYRFSVVAANENGFWNETGASLVLTQQPWFYQTWWFYAVAIIALAAIIASVYLWRTAGLRRVVRQQTIQIERQHEKEARMQAELERSTRLESLGVLAGGIAHDFNNLLTAIMANVGLAKLDDRVQAIAGDLLNNAELGAKRAADLTQQLLTFAKGGDPVRTSVALPDVVRESAEFARRGSQVRCELEVAPDLPPVDADRGQISRVVHNLVLNAGQAMPAGGIVRLSLKKCVLADREVAELRAGEYVKMSISDSGSGIAPEHLQRIFDPYFSTKSKNSGLGLATVHSVVKKHQGHVSVESTLGKGATFHVWLPVAKGAPASEPKPLRLAPTGPLRVLFMDDDDIVRQAATMLLQRLGHDATVVNDGALALREFTGARAAGRPFDVVVLDLTVPGGMGGKVTMEALLKLDPQVRAIVSSGYSSDPVLANFREHGFRAVVPKPYTIEALAAAIRMVAES